MSQLSENAFEGSHGRPSRPARLLEIDPELGSRLSPGSFAEARRRLVVPVHRVDGPQWLPDTRAGSDQLGFLLVRGLMVREISLAKGRSLELLTRGDLLRPAQEDSASFVAARWRLLEPVMLAELGHRLTTALGRYPQLVDALLGRVMQRSRSLAAFAAIQSIRGLDDRLLASLWHLAERHGSRGEEGVDLPLPLTHQILADLVGARRPSVTAAAKRLADRKLARRTERGWQLGAQLPPQLLDWTAPGE